MVSWSDECAALQLVRAYQFTHSLARLLRRVSLSHTHATHPQIGSFCLSACASGYMFARWRRLDEDGRRDVWRLYGVFTMLMCMGSCVGAASWSLNALALADSYAFSYNIHSLHSQLSDRAYTPAQLAYKLSASESYLASVRPMYALEFAFLSVVKLCVRALASTVSTAPLRCITSRCCCRCSTVWRTSLCHISRTTPGDGSGLDAPLWRLL